VAIFQVDIEKSFAGEFWTNVYHVEAQNLQAAAAQANDIAAGERVFHGNFVYFTKARVRSAVEGDDVYSTVILNFNGSRGSIDPIAPLFNVVRVDFQADAGRPARKYYRGCLNEGWVDGSVLTEGTVNVVLQGVQPLVNGGVALQVNLTKPNGVALVDVAVALPIGMRQLRRGSRRRSQPILP
jgi:hypothetical protein